MTTSWLWSIAIASSTTALVAAAACYYNNRASKQHDYETKLQQLNAEWSKKRQEERTGRIRAEVKLRTVLKELRQLQTSNTNSNSRSNGTCNNMTTLTLNCIGTTVSPYTKRMGTPRQPQLVPASRGYIALAKEVQPELLSGIEQYSHIWVIFEFHANTNNADTNNKRAKIRPPRGNGVKVGQLATRSPHRPNPVGLSLVKLERWDASTRQLHVTGLDLVHGTPVYDIKPVVPWDVPGYTNPGNKSSKTTIPSSVLKVPPWVEQDDAISHVEFSKTAEAQLATAVTDGLLAPLYTVANDGIPAALLTLKQILAQDPRSSHKGLKENARGDTACLQNYNFVFCNHAQIYFGVELDDDDAIRVRVTQIAPIQFDASSYVDGIPLMSESTTTTTTNSSSDS